MVGVGERGRGEESGLETGPTETEVGSSTLHSDTNVSVGWVVTERPYGTVKRHLGNSTWTRSFGRTVGSRSLKRKDERGVPGDQV